MVDYAEIEGLSGVYSVHKGNLRSVAIVLRDRSLCVISPIEGVPATAYNSLEAVGEVNHVLAPNHYHNKGIAEFLKIYPDAKTYSSAAAADRLKKQTGIKFGSLETLRKQLRKGISFLEPDGLKTGEVWLRFSNPQVTAWLVVDSFCGPKLKKQEIEADTPELLTTFPNYGVADAAEYGSWVEEQLRKDTPTLLVPCHGSIVRSSRLPKSLKNLVMNL